MADDTRQTVDANVQSAAPRVPANTMPGGTAHTAGGEKTTDGGPTYFEVVRTLGPDYYLNFHKRPCVRDAQLQGIAAGFAGGSVAAIVGSWCALAKIHTTFTNSKAEPVYLASNWAVATWCGVSVVSYQVCQYYRSKEKAGIKQAQERMEKKRASMEAKKEARRRQREEYDRQEQARRQEEERQKSWRYWYEKNLKFW